MRRCNRNALRCYACGELGHRSTACPNHTRWGLLVGESHGDHDSVYDSQEEDEDDESDVCKETSGDTGLSLVLHRSCLVPRKEDDQWMRTNIFRSTCTIRDHVCSFIIDS